MYLLLFVPFFCAANCICLCFLAFRRQVHRIYSLDLLGAGAGAVGLVLALYVLSPARALGVVGALGMLAAGVAWLECSGTRRWAAALALPAVAAMLSLEPPVQVSQFKGLSQALRVIGAQALDERSGPLGQLTTVASPEVPFRHAPGLSLNAPGEPPPQLAVFNDADSLSVIDRHDGSLGPLQYLDYLTSALPYHLVESPTVLLLGAGGGSGIWQALLHGAVRIDAVELNPQMVTLADSRFADFSGGPYRQPGVHVHYREARGFVARHPGPWDVIQVNLMDSFGAAAAGLHALSENYVYTVEGFARYLQRLSPQGVLAVTRWIRLPPRDTLKAFATAVAALESAGVEAPARHLALIRGWRTSTLLVRKGPFRAADLERLRAFAGQRWFDLVYYPGIGPAEANRYNQLQGPWFFEATQALLGGQRESFLDEYKFNIRPATDDRPHYFHFMKWRTLPEILSLRSQGGLPLLEQGYPVLVATLFQATLVSALLILLPLFLLGRDADHGPDTSRGALLGYFAAIGVAFMCIEIAFIQKFILFLSHPLYAVAVVLSAFLVFAGVGSGVSGRWRARLTVGRVTAGIVALALAYLAWLPTLFEALMPWPDLARILVSVVLIAPLATLMGIPFPLVLGRLAERWVPWAWGINGCASVVSAVFATLLAVHAGFRAVVGLALVAYVLAAGIAGRYFGPGPE